MKDVHDGEGNFKHDPAAAALVCSTWPTPVRGIERIAGDRLAFAYRWLQDNVTAVGLTEDPRERKRTFQEGVDAFREQKY